MTKLHIACAARRDYVPHSAAMVHSALTTAGMPVHVHYLHGDDVPAQYRRRLSDLVRAHGGEISLIHVTADKVAGLRTSRLFPASHWYRIFLPRLLGDLDRVLYLDADTIVVDSLTPLWQTDLSDHYLAAVTNVFQSDHLHRPGVLGLSGPNVYFNSGVMLLNLELMRRDKTVDAVRDYALENYDDLRWPEQDAMNVVMGARRLPLHPRWNCMNSILTLSQSIATFGAQAVEEARQRPAIRHFEGPAVNKPWHYLCERDMRDLYREHRRKTPWPRWRPEGMTPANVLRRAAGRVTAAKAVEPV